MSEEQIMVKQWSFCTCCKGQGCHDCGNTGVTVKLIPLDSLTKTVREEYGKAQPSIIAKQKSESG